MKVLLGFFASLLVGSTYSFPATNNENEQNQGKKANLFASKASQLIATELLKHNIDIDANQVYSPLGVVSIMAVLSEAAAGETYTEFNKIFDYPKERGDVRSSFRDILANYQHNDYDSSAPSFQSWFYIYRNYSAKEEFKRIIHDNYFVQVKDISREEYDWSVPSTSLDSESTNSKDVIGFETLKRINLDDDDDETLTTTSIENYGVEVLDKTASKFDRFVDDKQYVEKPVALAEIQEQKDNEKDSDDAEEVEVTTEKLLNNEKAQDNDTTEKVLEELEKPVSEENVELETQKIKREDDINVEENETVQEDEKLHKSYNAEQLDVAVPIQELITSNEPEKVSLSLNTKTSNTKATDEILLALESHLSSVSRVYGARSLFRSDDITSGLSANSITGRSADSKTKMLLFNGLYFRGRWATPFYELRDSDDEYFFMTNDDAIQTPTMHAKGQFYIADMDHLKARMLCLPYENKKYTLSIILPNEPEGLNAVIEKLQPSDFELAKSHAKLLESHITLPKFQIEETSRSEAILKDLGLKKLFSRTDADLSLLSEDSDLHIDEIVQFVNVRVDDGGSSTNALSAANPEARSPEKDVQSFKVNRPFLYFVMDCDNHFVLASGKVYTPEYKEEKPISIDVELAQS